jgi:site-specific DNA recombinase
MLILEELARFEVRVMFCDAPSLDDDPQARLLVQIQGVVAEYERAKITERHRRGKLWRARSGEVVAWKAPYGYRRVTRSAERAAHLEIFDPEAQVVRRIFDDYVSGGHSMRQICRRLNADGVPSPAGNPVWPDSTIARLLRNEAYIGRVYFNRSESTTTSKSGRRSTRQRIRPREEWIAIEVPVIVTEDVFDAAQRVSRDNSKWSPRNLQQQAWLLRGLVKCGHCAKVTHCHQMRGAKGVMHRYYNCPNHDTLKARGEEKRCPERNIRADALDAFVFEQVRAALLAPELMLMGEAVVAARQPIPDDELLTTELARLERKIAAGEAERRRLADLYQTGLVEVTDLRRRASERFARRIQLTERLEALVAQRHDLAVDNRLRQRVADFVHRVAQGIDLLDFAGRQRLLRILVEEVRVTGWHVEIQLRIPLDGPLDDDPHGGTESPGGRPAPGQVSSQDGLRSLQRHRAGMVPGDGSHADDVAVELCPRRAQSARPGLLRCPTGRRSTTGRGRPGAENPPAADAPRFPSWPAPPPHPHRPSSTRCRGKTRSDARQSRLDVGRRVTLWCHTRVQDSHAGET